MAEGYAYRRAGNPAAALKAYGEAVRLSRGNQGVRNEAAGGPARHGRALRRRRLLPATRGRSRCNRRGAMVRWGVEIRLARPGAPFRRHRCGAREHRRAAGLRCRAED